jgi:hypothetical protein
LRSFNPVRVGELGCTGCDPASPLIAAERSALIRSYAALRSAITG